MEGVVGRKEKLYELCEDIYIKMYNEAEPQLDYLQFKDDVVSKRITISQDWFMNHFLDEDRIYCIMEEVLSSTKAKRLRISKDERRRIKATVLLGHSPSSVRKEDNNESTIH